MPAVLGMRISALGALALIVGPSAARPAAARRSLPAGVAQLLLLIHVVGGMHNDGLMIGLMLAWCRYCGAGVGGAFGSALLGLAVM